MRSFTPLTVRGARRAARGRHVHRESLREELRVPQGEVVPNMVAIIRHIVAVGKPADDLGAPLASDQDSQDREPDCEQPDVGQEPDIEAVGLRVLLQLLDARERFFGAVLAWTAFASVMAMNSRLMASGTLPGPFQKTAWDDH